MSPKNSVPENNYVPQVSKFIIPPPMSLPARPKGSASNYEEDSEKSKFMRFLKMVERKKEAVLNRQNNNLNMQNNSRGMGNNLEGTASSIFKDKINEDGSP